MKQERYVRNSPLEAECIELISEWRDCTRCQIGCDANTHVMWEFSPFDSTPAWMIIGEGPGMSEDTVARPFIGESGKLLRRAIYDAAGRNTLPPPFCLTNLIMCRPYLTKITTTGNRAPSHEEIVNCAPRLAKLINIVQPRLIVAAGNVPNDYLSGAPLPCPLEHIRHPSYILRRGIGEYETYVHSLRAVINRVRQLCQE